MNTNTCTPSNKTPNTIQIIITSWKFKYSVDRYSPRSVMQVDSGIATSKALRCSVYLRVHVG